MSSVITSLMATMAISTEVVIDPVGDVRLVLQAKPVVGKANKIAEDSLAGDETTITVAVDDTTTIEHVTTADEPAEAENPQEPANVYLVVSSKVLSLISPVFRALFIGGFKEAKIFTDAQALSQRYDQELPEDDVEAMKILCMVFHGKNDRVATSALKPELVKNIAILVDKYDCAPAVKFAAQAWLGQAMRRLTKADRWANDEDAAYTSSCMLLAYLADLPQEFTVFASIAVSNTPFGNEEVVGMESIEPCFKHDIMDRMRDAKQHWFQLLIETMIEPLDWVWRGANCGAKAVGSYVLELHRLGLMTHNRSFESSTVRSVIEASKLVRHSVEPDPHCVASAGDWWPDECACSSVYNPGLDDGLKRLCEEIHDAIMGSREQQFGYLCLDCLKGNIEECRNPHKQRT